MTSLCGVPLSFNSVEQKLKAAPPIIPYPVGELWVMHNLPPALFANFRKRTYRRQAPQQPQDGSLFDGNCKGLQWQSADSGKGDKRRNNTGNAQCIRIITCLSR